MSGCGTVVPLRGVTGVLIKIQQMWERRERELEREKYFHPPNKETHKQQADGVRVRKTRDLRAAAAQTLREDVSLKGRKSHTDTLTNKYRASVQTDSHCPPSPPHTHCGAGAERRFEPNQRSVREEGQSKWMDAFCRLSGLDPLWVSL